MDLKKLFKMQQKLDDHILEEHPELKGQNNLEWKVLALQVELGECANEWRGFKKWSKDQEPRTNCEWDYTLDDEPIFRNLVLEEYVDCLHFILSIGLELDYFITKVNENPKKDKSITRMFSDLLLGVGTLNLSSKKQNYVSILSEFIELAEKLDFTWEQVEQAYMDKNAVNHERQNNGY